jgi:hypothetical protein
MGCGCKNKGNNTPTNNQQIKQSVPAPGNSNPAIQESIKKIVEKYYKKK